MMTEKQKEARKKLFQRKKREKFLKKHKRLLKDFVLIHKDNDGYTFCGLVIAGPVRVTNKDKSVTCVMCLRIMGGNGT